MIIVIVLGASRARALSSFMDDLIPLNCPKANSTFVVDKKGMGSIEEILSPQNMFSPENKTYIKSQVDNQTYNMPIQSKTILNKNSDENVNLKTEDSPHDVKNSNTVVHKRTTRSSSKKNWYFFKIIFTRFPLNIIVFI